MNTDRLTLVASIIKPLPASAINMGRWACGTQGCMIGHAAMDPRVQAQGLWLLMENYNSSRIQDWVRVGSFADLNNGDSFADQDDDRLITPHVEGQPETQSIWITIAAWFSIAPWQASALFGGWLYRSNKHSGKFYSDVLKYFIVSGGDTPKPQWGDEDAPGIHFSYWESLLANVTLSPAGEEIDRQIAAHGQTA